MSDPNSRDPNPADKSSPDSSPPPVWLPPRLREKLETPADSGDDWKPKTGSPVPAIVTVAMVLVIAVAGILWWRSASQKTSPSRNATAQAEARPTSRADSLADIARADSLARAASRSVASTPAATAPAAGRAEPSRAAGTTAAKATLSPPAPPTSSPAAARSVPAAGTGSESGAAPPSAGRGFGIVVGSYLFEDRAKSELSRLEGVTGLSGMVSAGAGSGFDVILGKFGSRAAAEKKAAALVDSNLVAQAQVVARPK